MKIWDGTSATRSDTLVRKGPDGEDWKTITKELQATQKFLISLVGAEDLPDIVVEIKKLHNQILTLQVATGKLTVPEDVKTTVVEISAKIDKLHNIYAHAAEVLQTVNLLQCQLLNLGKRIDSHTEKTSRKHTSLENRVAAWQRASEGRWNERLDKAEEQLGAISLALGLKKFGE
jgi:pimeloyl-CoA synthetase